VTVKAKDDGGGADTSADQTFTIALTAVNDAPSFTKGGNQTVLEDAGLQTVAGWATSINKGAPNETAQTLTFNVTTSNNDFFAVLPAVAADGTLTYQTAANANGTVTVTVSLSDSGDGTNTSPAETFTIEVTAVNDAPSFTAGDNVTVLEDAGAQSLAGWATHISAGAADEGDQTLTFTVSNNKSSLFAAEPAISPTGELTFTPAADANGSATVTVSLADNAGTANGGSDTSPAQTFTITVTAVNDQPSFAKGLDQTVPEDAAAQTVSGWATALNAGPSDEAGQTFTFTVTNDNTALFSAQPAVAADGKLTYTPAADANGSATVTVRLSDNGGTLGGGVDTSDPQSFRLPLPRSTTPP
jgi:hypothetical protein